MCDMADKSDCVRCGVGVRRSRGYLRAICLSSVRFESATRWRVLGCHRLSMCDTECSVRNAHEIHLRNTEMLKSHGVGPSLMASLALVFVVGAPAVPVAG